jgi:hypothetical protein
MKKRAAETHSVTSAAIAKMAAAMPWKENARIDIFPYENAIVALRERGYSYGEIAAWLSEKLNAPVQRGQVYYVCQARAEEIQEQFEEAEKKGKVRYLPKISPEDAELAAKEQDKARDRK